MEVKKRANRLKDVNEISISVISDEKNLPKDRVFYNYIKDISESGAKIQANIPLPVNALLKIDFTLDTPERQVAAGTRASTPPDRSSPPTPTQIPRSWLSRSSLARRTSRPPHRNPAPPDWSTSPIRRAFQAGSRNAAPHSGSPE